ncbi:hypothetical protein Hamer_G025430 [Homarus americanus]|uniref:Uncharacterized protein n=1 Tax=Homarus americanus TaxID=6706 RepID=A0A8J5JL84_HOMAM|nr:hypothetical protein Hamer_G025430 [Homarus americanus]
MLVEFQEDIGLLYCEFTLLDLPQVQGVRCEHAVGPPLDQVVDRLKYSMNDLKHPWVESAQGSVLPDFIQHTEAMYSPGAMAGMAIGMFFLGLLLGIGVMLYTLSKFGLAEGFEFIPLRSDHSRSLEDRVRRLLGRQSTPSAWKTEYVDCLEDRVRRLLGRQSTSTAWKTEYVDCLEDRVRRLLGRQSTPTAWKTERRLLKDRAHEIFYFLMVMVRNKADNIAMKEYVASLEHRVRQLLGRQST